jgi:photosystem II stability/assembly factor-like uncharacterized protein
MADKKWLGLALAVFTALAFFGLIAQAQQGWSQAQTIRFGNNKAEINAVFYNGEEIWIAGAGGYIARSYDDGRSFQQVNVGVDDGLNDVYARGRRIWIVGDAGVIIKSTDGGRSFIKQYYTSRNKPGSDPQGAAGAVDLYSVLFTDADYGWIVGDNGLVLSTTNGGISWSEQASGTEAQLFHLSFHKDRGWIVGTGGTVLHTYDGGRNWYPQRSGVTDDLNRVLFATDAIGLITGDNGTLLRTENGGATWERVRLGFNEPLFGISFIDKKTGWVVGYSGRIIRTYDGGRSWVEQDSSTAADLFSVSFYRNRGYAIGRDGVIMKYFERR